MNIPKHARKLVAHGLLKIVEMVIEHDEHAHKTRPSKRSKRRLDGRKKDFKELKKQVDEL